MVTVLRLVIFVRSSALTDKLKVSLVNIRIEIYLVIFVIQDTAVFHSYHFHVLPILSVRCTVWLCLSVCSTADHPFLIFSCHLTAL